MTPLAGRRILVTRDEGRDGTLSTLLRQEGAIPVLQPVLDMVPLLDPAARSAIRRELDTARWLVVTSPRAVAFLAEAGVFDSPPPPHLRVAVAGSRTAAALESRGWPTHLVPERAGGEPLLEAFLALDEAPGGTVVFPASARAGDVLPRGLEAAGYRLEMVALYTPRPREQDVSWWEEELGGGLAALTFTSPSAVEGLVEGLGDAPVLDRLRALPAAVQGPTTAEAARQGGWLLVEEASPRTFNGLVAAVERLLQDPAPSRNPDLRV